LKSYIHVHINPMMTLGRAQGTTTRARAKPRHQKLWFRRSAAPRPRRNCNPTTPTIQIKECQREIQKTSSRMMVAKFRKPMNAAASGS
jgi:hypothetical protein